MATIVRPATPADAASIADFQLQMARETESKTLDLETVLTAVKAVFDDPMKGFYLVAQSKGVVVACLLITYEWSDWRNRNLWYIQSVFVSPRFRSQGIFRAMYREVIQRAKAAQAMFVRLYVETDNQKAQQIYESLGMKKMPYYMYDIRVSG